MTEQLEFQLVGEDLKQMRRKWVESSQFHSLDDEKVLVEVLDRVSQNRAATLLLDLDSTLYEVAPRTHQILLEWARSEESQSFSEIRDALLQLNPTHIGYSVKDTFMNIGFCPERAPERGLALQAWQSAKAFWFKRFFTNEYLAFDRPYAGAQRFVQKAHDLGAKIIYLTGRDEPGMGEGTRRNFIRDGFPWGTSQTSLLMKPKAQMNDLEFKKGTAEFVQSQGRLVASFENEPPNVVAFQKIFPESMHIFVDTVCSDHQAEPGSGLYRISGYGRFSRDS